METKMIKVDVKVHRKAKENAARAGVSLKKYIALCVAQCESDVKNRK